MKKISLIGGGQIGGTLAHLSALRNIGNIVLFDTKGDFAKGKALDIMQSCHILNSDVKIDGTDKYEAISNSDVIIITAGSPRKPGMSRSDLIHTNVEVMKTVGENVKKYSPNAFVIVITNPLDAMVYAFQKVSQLPSNMVVGMAGVLDTARFCHFLSDELNVSKSVINAMVLGGHGDDMVPLMSCASVAGINLPEYIKNTNASQDAIEKIVQRTREGGAEIVKLLGTGSAYYAPAAAAISMAESYLFDQKKVIPCAVQLNGEYNVRNMYVGAPAVIGANGVEKIIELSMNNAEKAAMEKSINSVKELISIVNEKL